MVKRQKMMAHREPICDGRSGLSMHKVEIDHLVVAARNLDEGEDFVHQVLGVRMQPGGKHVEPGTHNRVLRLGAGCYLEVIAIDPEAGQPSRTRWFELDTADMRERLRQRPQLITWAVRAEEIEAVAARSMHPLGRIRSMSRGDLRWRLTMTDDGHMPEGGLIPFLIEWVASPHPTESMKEAGCSLAGLRGFHPEPHEVQSVLKSLGIEHLIALEKSSPGSRPSLAATIETPTGIRLLG